MIKNRVNVQFTRNKYPLSPTILYVICVEIFCLQNTYNYYKKSILSCSSSDHTRPADSLSVRRFLLKTSLNIYCQTFMSYIPCLQLIIITIEISLTKYYMRFIKIFKKYESITSF